MLLAFPSTFFQLRVILLKYGLVESKAHSPFQKVRVLILLSLSLKARAKYFARLSKEHAKRCPSSSSGVLQQCEGKG